MIMFRLLSGDMTIVSIMSYARTLASTYEVSNMGVHGVHNMDLSDYMSTIYFCVLMH